MKQTAAGFRQMKETSVLQKKLTMMVLLTGLMVPAFGQEDFKQDATVQITGNFTKSTTESGQKQGFSDSAGVLGSYRYFFHPNHGVEINYSYTRNSLLTSLGGVSASQRLNEHEFTAAYVYRLSLGRVTPFALAGVGATLYDPAFAAGTSMTAKPAFIYGAGADIRVTSRTFIRAQYRGQIRQSLNSGLSIVPSDDRWLHTAQPSVGFGFRF
jgi:opacity protein-like surface antigen